MDQKIHEDKEFLAGLLVGGILGASVAIALSTEEGREIRKKLKIKGKQLLKELPDMADEIQEKAQDAKDTLIEEAMEAVSPAIRDLQTRGRFIVRKFFSTKKK